MCPTYAAMLNAVNGANMSSSPPVKVRPLVARPSSSQRQSPSFPDTEGLIPLHPPDSEPVYYIVDCPDLHPIEATLLFSDGYVRGSNVRCSHFRGPESKITLFFAVV